MKKWTDNPKLMTLFLILWAIPMGIGIFGVLLVMGFTAMELDVTPPTIYEEAKAFVEKCLE